ncbi:helix-turn-helix transcriptional regulator [uncultured Clostridium sp.]|uniref:helix-turn-helix domain-containing protein n=1 Tax=uncultured Clostridium sp. TaxID=59620 RepID=UPI0025CDDB7F|nr:helix-turn-helix transcriptional regulator [uncultured Clostridium sp.]
MCLKERFKKIRKDNKLSQAAFGKKIGISPSQIACYETGYREITDRAIKDICREFNVNEEWLRTGNGEIYLIAEDDKKIADAIAKISLSENKNLKEIAEKLTKLNDTNLELINRLIDGLMNGNN